MRTRFHILCLVALLSAAAPVAAKTIFSADEPAKPAVNLTPRLPTDCVPAGCAKQECTERRNQYNFNASCIMHEAYDCFPQMGECKRQPNDKCGWTPTKELAACITDANAKEAADQLEEEDNRFLKRGKRR